jgi:hypothetical protein
MGVLGVCAGGARVFKRRDATWHGVNIFCGARTQDLSRKTPSCGVPARKTNPKRKQHARSPRFRRTARAMLLRVPAAAVRAGGAPPPPRAAAAAAAAPPLRAAAGGSRLHCRHAGFASGAPLPASPRRRVRAAAASASRPGVPTSAVLALFSRGPRSVAVPLNLYAALRVSPRAPAGAIDVAAAERAPPPEAAAEALSGEALAARGALLALAGRTLAHAPSRAAYDAALSAGAADVDVPLGSLPGALALLTARAACAALVCCACVRRMRVRERLRFGPCARARVAERESVR